MLCAQRKATDKPCREPMNTVVVEMKKKQKQKIMHRQKRGEINKYNKNNAIATRTALHKNPAASCKNCAVSIYDDVFFGWFVHSSASPNQLCDFQY